MLVEQVAVDRQREARRAVAERSLQVDPVLADEVVDLEGNEDIVVGAPGLMVSTGLGDGRVAS